MKLRNRITLVIASILIIGCTSLYMWNMKSTHNMVDNIRELEIDGKASVKRLTMIDTHEENNDERLFIGFILVVIAGSAISYFMTGIALQPISELTEKIGKYKTEDLSKHIELDHKGNDEVSNLVDAFNDMSDRLDKSFKRERRLSDSIAHEFRTPLAVLLSKYEVMEMKGDSVTPDELKEIIRLSKEKVEYLSSITSKLLILNREMQSESVDSIPVSDIFEDLEFLHSKMAKEKSITLTFHSDDAVISVDTELFTQMLSNFVENALKYTPENGKVEIEETENEEGIIFSIKDDGIGIPEQHKGLIFEPFYRVDKSRNKETGGSGLGLVFAKEVIDLYHGKVTIEDNVPKGTVFTLEFEEITR